MTEADVADFRERLCETAARRSSSADPWHFNMRELASRFRVSAMTPYPYFRIIRILPWCGRERSGASPTSCKPPMTAKASKWKISPPSAAPMSVWPEEETNYRLMFDLSQPSDETIPELEFQARRAAR